VRRLEKFTARCLHMGRLWCVAQPLVPIALVTVLWHVYSVLIWAALSKLSF
jgi:hypothetical protein